jgi:SAM-dependent methyltransferase
MSKEKPYLRIVEHYEQCLERFGDCHLGVDWQNEQDADVRYQVMLDIIPTTLRKEQPTLLDFGCGTAALYDYAKKKNIDHFKYSGLDISPAFTKICKCKYPDLDFFTIDVLDPDACLPIFDYIVLNGVFTEKISLSFNEMFNYFCLMISKVFSLCMKGMAFNVRSNHVDVMHPDLFHLPMDTLASFLTRNISSNFIIRNDYNLEEYAVYLYRRPTC